jgi:ribosome biogenesis GTPase / thiamine phosphate phosphatase
VNLEQLGWNDFFARQSVKGVPARVVFASRERFLVWSEAGELEAEPSGALRHASILWPTVGDWVALRQDSPLIVDVLERRTTLSRKQPGRGPREQVLAANIDVLFIVSGLDGDFNLRRLERYLAVARESGARAVIALNKADLAPELGFNLNQLVERTQAVASDVPVLVLSALHGQGVDALAALMARSETAALIGSSGAGKSTILNRLLGDQRQRTYPVRVVDDRGRHTTTARELFLMPGDWLLIDMPGLREILPWAAPGELESAFADIRALAAGCRFRDCKHAGEPGCAVIGAGLDAARLANLHKMRRELEYLERRADPRLARETRAKWKAIEKSVRRNPKREW